MSKPKTDITDYYFADELKKFKLTNHDSDIVNNAKPFTLFKVEFDGDYAVVVKQINNREM